MVLELNLWMAKVCTSLPHIAPQGYVAASLKTTDSYLQIVCALSFQSDVPASHGEPGGHWNLSLSVAI